MEDKLILGGKEFKSRFILGSGKYNLNLILCPSYLHLTGIHISVTNFPLSLVMP